MAPWLLLSNFDPIGPAVAVALLGVLTIPVLFWVTKKIFGTKEALIASSVYAVSMPVVINTRFSWNPNPMPLVSLLLIWGLYQVYVNHKAKAWLYIWIAWAVAMQLHYMALLWAPVIGIVTLLDWWRGWRKTNEEFRRTRLRGYASASKANEKTNSKLKIQYLNSRIEKIFGIRHSTFIILARYWLFGFSIFLLSFIPLIIFDLRHDFLNYQGLLEFFQKGHHSPQGIFQPIKDMEGRMYQLVGHLLGLDPWPQWRNSISWVLTISFGLLIWLKRAVKKYQLLALLFFCSVFGLALYSGDVYTHYMGFAIPVPFLVLGTVGGYWWRQHILGKLGVGVIVAGVILANLYQLDYLTPLGWQIKDVRQVATVIAADTAGKLYNITAMDSTRDYRAMNYRYFLEVEGVTPLPITNYAEAECLYVVAEQPIDDVSEITTWEIQSFLGAGVKKTKEWKFDGGPWVYRLERVSDLRR